ncbi:uncharacterized protein LOC111106512 isoform X2 [Crassostrea virginica]
MTGDQLFCLISLCVIQFSDEINVLKYSLEEYRCEGNIRINEDMEVLFSYNGGQIDSLCHAMTIIGRDAQNMKQYQLCLKTLRYSDPDCEILTGLVSANSQEYNCTHVPPTKICFPQNRNLRVLIEAIDLEKQSRNTSFLFKVSAFVTRNRMTLIINISAGSAAGLVLFIIVVMVIRICKRRLKQPETQKTDETEVYENSI